jgi:L-threonylcarbamoyladenylate synthase
MSEAVSIERDGPDEARAALERCVGRGGVAIFPADTVYGLACDPLDPAAARRIDELKGRARGKPSAVMFFAPLAMRELIGGLGPRTRHALAALLPGSVTLVVANPDGRYPLACGENTRGLGLRLIGGPLAGARCAVLQTSANLSGDPPPRALTDVDEGLRSAVDLEIDAGELPGTASTVLDLSEIDSGGGWRVLREGHVPVADVERALGPWRRSPPG